MLEVRWCRGGSSKLAHSNFQGRYISKYVLEFLRAVFLFLKCIRSNAIIEGIKESGKEISLK